MGEPFYRAAQNLDLSRHTLARYVKMRLDGQYIFELNTQFSQRLVFIKHEENEPADYLQNETYMPPPWREKGEAGSDWLAGFMKTNETVSLLKRQATSTGLPIGFNRVSIGRFFASLERYTFSVLVESS